MPSTVVSEHWTARSASLQSEDFFGLLGETPFALLHGEGRWIIHGEDPLIQIQDAMGNDFIFERSGEVPPILPDFIGFVGYEHGYSLDPILPRPIPSTLDLPDFQFSLHRKLRIYDRATRRLYEAQRQLPRQTENLPNLLRAGAFSATKIQDTDTRETYGSMVQRIREEIARGNVYQVNLTRQEQWQYEGDLRVLAKRLADLDPAPHSAFIAESDFAIISASPELFLRIREGRITTRPIKGTSQRGATPTEEQELADKLMSSPKNRSELAMIVDLLRNDLTKLCRVPSVIVEAFPQLESFANVHHLVATVSGELRPAMDFQSLLQAVFPGGSITGCPKLSAMTLIRELETHRRGVYTGALGWFSHDMSQVEFSITIRTLWATNSDLWFGVGGGVVWDSDPEEEYLETIHKARSILQCLSC